VDCWIDGFVGEESFWTGGRQISERESRRRRLGLRTLTNARLTPPLPRERESGVRPLADRASLIRRSQESRAGDLGFGVHRSERITRF